MYSAQDPHTYAQFSWLHLLSSRYRLVAISKASAPWVTYEQDTQITYLNYTTEATICFCSIQTQWGLYNSKQKGKEQIWLEDFLQVSNSTIGPKIAASSSLLCLTANSIHNLAIVCSINRLCTIISWPTNSSSKGGEEHVLHVTNRSSLHSVFQLSHMKLL